ncbi:hypothetical protein AM2_2416 [Lactococcus cremoris]|nr:hypothetical protein AB995_1089 [Lactococcus cremoris]KZK39277.1 hypothetical protein LMG6897_1620 [Lactococcus cremoris]KZK40768.1 hypothetical protein N41_0592 [Lactococcus cremoris]KZK44489.1 hypothetical protein SK110_2452 [Lactococcus cremoris]KZK45517.1 hypothetical protein B40_0917 [Lactococcus cremoris]
MPSKDIVPSRSKTKIMSAPFLNYFSRVKILSAIFQNFD